MVLRVTSVEPLEGHRLRLGFNDGVVGDVDLSGLLHGLLGEPPRDLRCFRRVRVDPDARTVVWPNGLDPAPEMLRDAVTSALAATAQLAR